MKRLYLIGGPMGVGKTTVCQELKTPYRPQRLFGRGLVLGHGTLPGDGGDEGHGPGEHRLSAGAVPSVCSAYETVIFCWVMHQREIIQELLARLPLEGVEVRAVSLLATAETLQARIGKDVAAGLRTWDVLERSLQRLPLYQDLPTEKLWVDDLAPQQAAQRLAGDRAVKGEIPWRKKF